MIIILNCHCVCLAGGRERRHGDALLLPVRGATGSFCLFQQEGEQKLNDELFYNHSYKRTVCENMV